MAKLFWILLSLAVFTEGRSFLGGFGFDTEGNDEEDEYSLSNESNQMIYDDGVNTIEGDIDESYGDNEAVDQYMPDQQFGTYEAAFEESPKQVNLPALDKDFYKKLWEQTLKLSHDKPFIDGAVKV